MGAASLSSRAVLGSLFARIEAAGRPAWVSPISRVVKSNQASEEYAWLGMTPTLREWVGARNAKGFRENGLTVENVSFESTLEVDVREKRRDKWGQVDARISELAPRANQHWASLLSTLTVNGHAGTSGLAYDGQYFFDTDHADPGAEYTTAQDNDLAVDISALPVALHGSTTAPSVGEAAMSIMAGLAAILGFKDDRGEPLNELASEFLILAPTNLWQVLSSAISNPQIDSGQSNPIKGTALAIAVHLNPRLTATDTFFVFRRNSPTPAYVRQVEVPEGQAGQATDADENADLMFSAIAEGSELEFREKLHHYGVEASRNAAYFYWQSACRVQMI